MTLYHDIDLKVSHIFYEKTFLINAEKGMISLKFILKCY